jgi:hypothetical protein
VRVISNTAVSKFKQSTTLYAFGLLTWEGAMILEQKKIEINQQVVFETIVCNTDTTFNFHR